MTGMSSLMGYTRRQVPHFKPEPSAVIFTGVLHSGQTRMSRSSWETAICFLALLVHSSRAASLQATSEPLGFAKFPHHVCNIAALAVHRVIHPPHLGFGDPPGKSGE